MLTTPRVAKSGLIDGSKAFKAGTAQSKMEGRLGGGGLKGANGPDKATWAAVRLQSVGAGQEPGQALAAPKGTQRGGRDPQGRWAGLTRSGRQGSARDEKGGATAAVPHGAEPWVGLGVLERPCLSSSARWHTAIFSGSPNKGRCGGDNHELSGRTSAGGGGDLLPFAKQFFNFGTHINWLPSVMGRKGHVCVAAGAAAECNGKGIAKRGQAHKKTNNHQQQRNSQFFY